MKDSAAQLRSLWFRVALLFCSLLLRGQHDVGVGAHCESRIVGCLFNSSDAKQWTYTDQHTYDGELITFFDFDQRKFVATKDWMQSNVDRLNADGSAEATYQAAISMCENNIHVAETGMLPRRVKPKITIRPKVSSHMGQSALLTCHVTGFYPSKIEVTWLKNGAPVPSGAINTVLLSDGDWTYQVEELLQYHPVSGDTYTCRVEHISLAESMDKDWGVQSTTESERTKIIVGALGFVFGLVILLAGVIMKLRNAKAILDSTGHGPRLMPATVA